MSSLPYLHSTRHLRASGYRPRTTIRLENAFWSAIDSLAEESGIGWHDWMERALACKPEQVNSASWLRLSVLEAYGGPTTRGSRS